MKNIKRITGILFTVSIFICLFFMFNVSAHLEDEYAKVNGKTYSLEYSKYTSDYNDDEGIYSDLDRPHTENESIRIIDHVVYKNNGGYYTVIDYFDTNEAAKNAKKINIVSEIDGIPVESITINYTLKVDMSNIKSITLSDNLLVLGHYSFSDLDGVKTIKLPESLVYIGDAFCDMKSLQSITIPSKVTVIKDSFRHCENLEKVNIKGKVTIMSEGSFFWLQET